MSPSLILSIILLYFVVLYAIAYFTSRAADNDSFFIGNRKSPWYVVAFGMIGASLSGVTFISVPGWVGSSQFLYMQMVLGYFIGYLAIAHILLPIYYKMRLTSIYSYLGCRFGNCSYKTGTSFFLLSRILGASARLYLVANVMQVTIFDAWDIPFWLTVFITVLFIWVYTFKGGIKTIIWTDTLQTFFMLLAVGISLFYISSAFEGGFSAIFEKVSASDYSRMFLFDDWNDRKHFVKYVLSGAFITIVMTGLDQDMMQKNLSCRSLSDAKKNMLWFSIVLIFVNLFFLFLGAMLYLFAEAKGISLPEKADSLYPMLATGGYLPQIVGVVFVLGLIAAAYSSADSALTSLTTSFTVDIIGIENKSADEIKRIRFFSHVLFSFLILLAVLAIRMVNDSSIINTLFVLAGYTYGPLLGMYSFGIFSRRLLVDHFVPFIAVLAPFLSFLINVVCEQLWGYIFGYELLLVNGLLCFLGLFLVSRKESL